MEERNYLLQILFLAGLCALFCGAIWLGIQKLAEYREEYDMMISERNNFEGIMENLRAKNRALQLINKIKIGDIKMLQKNNDKLEFQNEIVRLIDENGINMISMANDDKGVFKLSLRGDYYALIHLFAQWKMIPFASRITELKIKRDEILPSDFVDADLILEAWVAE